MPWPVIARGRQRGRTIGAMNRTEERYSVQLEGLRQAGVIQWWAFEAIKFRIAKDCFYTPDFMVMDKQGMIECHEVKGYWQDTARAKIKMAAELFPFLFVAVSYKHKQWSKEYFN